MKEFNLTSVQTALKELKLDSWLLYDFRGSNLLAWEILGIPKDAHITRRFFYYIPSEGEPIKLSNGIEAFHLDSLPGKKMVYSSRSSLEEQIGRFFKIGEKVAMEYSPMNNIPYLSKVDAGTIEFLREKFKIDIQSSGDLISMFGAKWTNEQFEENRKAADALYDIVELSFKHIKDKILFVGKTSEYEIQSFIMDQFRKRNMSTDSPPIVAVNENSANPHYCPNEIKFMDIKKNDFVLIDLWAKMNAMDSTMSDITWIGFVGNSVPEKYVKIADIVFRARDAAFELISERYKQSIPIKGYEADDAARKIISDSGYGEFFIHRTGHSITTETHGSGAHLDNYETKDERLLLPMTSFSIEPGIYLKGDFGVRSEIDVFIAENGKVIQTGKERQRQIIKIL